ncbi:MAG: type I secretion system permease/ATPase [Mesorhizobium sp.]|uniref:type I secretion system permease/ATPase n=5 Tax=Mesorhizobium TaxID=68287 RepID=UPI000F757524|nr:MULTISPECIES: type I secretion system permease/ATPase [unclassified Mesorhizobium]RVD69202.1 type I secretion system permease/ATPase [Mesorhizobium sp. M4A.F.Ca.ET.029.04.2.1]AZO48425.1 type I secretion system permease/ATPase [Mesorhizobium sp. M4B.F.Ca.ET.058.02.1.1]RVC41001.1 type I secretion system permease/ATPase [Mesorhizobium sp. M4A.F.Ca.ET.090.04.2.1]RVC75575.1 type I secretion system permease/ATPase [Mesorhizobium sp. M4A.F.Ca.ET.022.05.2.1]RVD41592.1 type I secretion system permea
MAIQNENAYAADHGLRALALFLRFHGVDAKPDQIRDRYGDGGAIGIRAMLRCARELGLKVGARKAHWNRLSSVRLPGIASLHDGGFLLLAKADDNGAVVLHPHSSGPKRITRAELEAIWDGRLILAGSQNVAQRALHTLAGMGMRGRDLLRRARDTVMRPRFADRRDTAAEATSTASESDDDSGLIALAILLRCHGIAADPDQIRHRMGAARVGVTEVLRCAKDFGLKAQAQRTKWNRLAVTPLPGIAVLRDGGFLILGKVVDDKLLVQRPSSPQPITMTQADLEAIWDGDIILMTRRAPLTDLSRRFDISWFLGAVHKYRHLLSEVLVASFFLQVFALLSPLFFQVIIDKVLVHRSMSTLDVLVTGLVALTVFETVLGTLRVYLFAHTTNRIDVELGARLFRHLLALPIAYFQTRRVGDSVARVRELENIRQFLTSSALTLVIDLVFTVVFLAVMFYYTTSLTLIVLASFPFYIGISAGAAPLFRRRLDEKFDRGSENQAFLVETVTGVETLKAMAVEPQMQRRWEEQLAAYVTASFRVLSLNNTASQAVQLINKLVVAATLYFGAKLVIGGDLTVGELVAFNMLASRVSMPVLRLAQIWQDFHQARLSIDRLGDILNTIPEPSLNPGRATLPAIRGQVTFEHATFRYRVDGPEVLHDVSFSVEPGQVIGIVGSSGSGKSTIAKLIQRLYVPESGRVLVDGVDLAMVDLTWLRRQIGVVLQENVLFNRSIRENIALADPAMPMERVVAAASLAGAHDFILELPEGYDTIVGERGSSLSGGQRQRVAIARALITDPRILILDEATSALDYESERAIQQNMTRISAGRTVFVIAHRLSTVRHANRIITIEHGRIVEDGTHDDLIRSNGRYANLHYLQAGIHEVR